MTLTYSCSLWLTTRLLVKVIQANSHADWFQHGEYIRVNTVAFFLGCEAVDRTEGRKEMFYLTTHSTHFIYGYMASDIWLRTILIVREETRCRHIGYSFRLAAMVLLYAPSHRQDSTYHGLCYTSRGALAGTRNSSMGPSHEGSIRRPRQDRTLPQKDILFFMTLWVSVKMFLSMK